MGAWYSIPDELVDDYKHRAQIHKIDKAFSFPLRQMGDGAGVGFCMLRGRGIPSVGNKQVAWFIGFFFGFVCFVVFGFLGFLGSWFLLFLFLGFKASTFQKFKKCVPTLQISISGFLEYIDPVFKVSNK